MKTRVTTETAGKNPNAFVIGGLRSTDISQYQIDMMLIPQYPILKSINKRSFLISSFYSKNKTVGLEISGNLH